MVYTEVIRANVQVTEHDTTCCVARPISMPSFLRNRSACDRCHFQKLRCLKQQGSLVCTRCAKAGARCVYSPPGTDSTTYCVASEAAADTATTTGTAAFDWMLGAPDSFDFNTFLSPTSPGMNFSRVAGQLGHDDNNTFAQPSPSPCDNNNNSSTTTTGSSSSSSSSPRNASLQTLGKILLDADDLWTRLPLQTALHVPQAESHARFSGKFPDPMASNTAIEKFFNLAQQLIDAYPAALDAALPKKSRPEPSCEIPDCTHVLALPASLSTLEDQVVAGRAGAAAPDVAVASLLFACHARLLDILDRLFLMATACTRVTLASRREPEFDLSELRVGSFVPKKTAAMLMQIFLLAHLVSGLANRIVLMDKAISVFAEEGDEDMDEVVVLRSQHKLLTNRQKSKGEQVRHIEDFLKQFDSQNI